PDVRTRTARDPGMGPTVRAPPQGAGRAPADGANPRAQSVDALVSGADHVRTAAGAAGRTVVRAWRGAPRARLRAGGSAREPAPRSQPRYRDRHPGPRASGALHAEIRPGQRGRGLVRAVRFPDHDPEVRGDLGTGRQTPASWRGEGRRRRRRP